MPLLNFVGFMNYAILGLGLGWTGWLIYQSYTTSRASRKSSPRLTPSKDSRLRWGESSCKGHRESMEDIPYKDVKNAFFAIFDGHGGRYVADYVSKRLPDEIIRRNHWPIMADAFREAFLNTDKDIHSPVEGSTAIVANIFADNTIHLAWVGDSRGMILRDSQMIALTNDHKPNRPDEKKRIEEAGGTVEDGQVPRILGSGSSLAVSRAFGDADYKPNLVTAEPEVISVDGKPGDIIILASDGMWDVLSTRKVAKVLNECSDKGESELLELYPNQEQSFAITDSGSDLRSNLMARALRDTAYNSGSRDNISVIVIRL